MASPILHFDVSGPHEENQHRFYAELFGWDVSSKGPGYALLSTPTVNGALVEADEPSVVIGVGVPNLAGAVARDHALGPS